MEALSEHQHVAGKVMAVELALQRTKVSESCQLVPGSTPRRLLRHFLK